MSPLAQTIIGGLIVGGGLTVLGAIFRMVAMMGEVRADVKNIVTRFDGHEQVGVDRHNSINKWFAGTETRITRIEGRLDDHDDKLVRLEYYKPIPKKEGSDNV